MKLINQTGKELQRTIKKYRKLLKIGGPNLAMTNPADNHKAIFQKTPSKISSKVIRPMGLSIPNFIPSRQLSQVNSRLTLA